ncbi:Histidine kinase-, DNA gyrase B-, and HSP90-like ATPase [Carpediemonas membranifera]|uniref:histidine kinase n=1 Tax=Carpediemonas membranifera TaxID=201153 RepID=A0A8J6AQN3_9EUKA|nr:Histidine kinase-, DNA gyrase B-, and HSP90-like ATPase [Carpediemonas membranifera]|eukprot:KAG9389570.1 Histidine kinase-, DNA gyrase B-, and HSP90-like ATPase [Carpediemonas membranifera]
MDDPDAKRHYVAYNSSKRHKPTDKDDIQDPFKATPSLRFNSVDEVEFEDLFDIDTLNELLDDTSNALAIGTLVSSPAGLPISRVHQGSEICAAVRDTELGQEVCEESALQGVVSYDRPVSSYTCSSVSHLHEGTAGVFLRDKLIALWVIGQVRTEDEPALPEESFDLGAELGLDRSWIVSHWGDTAAMTREEFDKKLQFLSIFASQLSEAAFVTYESGQLAAQLQEMNERLTAAKAELEDEVLAQTRHLAEANEVLAASLHARRLFLGRVSHDMRTPLLGINGTAILMEEEERVQTGVGLGDDVEMGSNLSIMQTSCELLLTYIDQLLDFSRLEALEDSGQPYVLEEQPMSMVEFLTSTAQLFEALAAQKSIALTVDGTAIEAALVHRCDPLRLAQLLSNVIGNAMKFTPEGGRVTCTVELLGPGLPPPRMVDPECDVAIVDTATTLDEGLQPDPFSCADVPAHYPAVPEGADLVAFSVSDTGPGIEEDRIYSIFSAFSQEDVSTPRVYGGSGLGLSMCRSICVDMYHGSLVVQNKRTGGALFIAILPLRQTDEDPSGFFDTIKSSATFQRHGIDFDRARESLADVEESMVVDPPDLDGSAAAILVVDDVDVNRIVIGRLLRSVLRERGRACRIHFAAEGGECLEMIQQYRYDLILIDLFMPNGIGGHDTVKTIRALEEDGVVERHAVVAVTASASPEVEDLCEKNGFDGILGKPFKMEDLSAVLDEFVLG